eukprot:gene9515-11677_t
MRIVDSNGITVRNSVFGNNGKWGIVTSHCDDLLLENNDCYGSVIEHGIYVANSGDRPTVRGNLIHGNTNSGLRANGDISQGGDGIISGAVAGLVAITPACGFVGIGGGSGLHVSLPNQSVISDADHALARVAVHRTKGVELLEEDVFEPGFLFEFAAGGGIEFFIDPDEAAGEGPAAFEGGEAALDEQYLQGAFVEAEDDAVHREGRARILV